VIQEIQIIRGSGIPIYFFSSLKDYKDEATVLQAGFFTAIQQISSELDNGQIQLIRFEKRNYYLTRVESFLLIFSHDDSYTEKDLNLFKLQVEESIVEFQKICEQSSIDGTQDNPTAYEDPVNKFENYMKQNGFITKIIDDQFIVAEYQTKASKALYKLVGYQPGICNIGRAERLKRLVSGGILLLVSLLIMFIMEILVLDPLYRLFLIIPNFLWFIGFYQYFFKFCITNARKEQAHME
jgi:hypothetical protein